MAFSVYAIEFYLYYCIINDKQPMTTIVNRSENLSPEVVTESRSKSQIR